MGQGLLELACPHCYQGCGFRNGRADLSFQIPGGGDLGMLELTSLIARGGSKKPSQITSIYFCLSFLVSADTHQRYLHFTCCEELSTNEEAVN